MKKPFTILMLMLALGWSSVMGASPAITSFAPASGSVGTLVTITGTNLSTPTAFTIGGVAAIVVSNDGTTLVGMVMTGASTGAITVITASGTSTSATNFTVTATPYPGSQQGSKLVGTGAIGNAGQGNSGAISADGSTAIIGGFYDDSNKGAAWIYTRSVGGEWTQQGNKLVGTGAVGNAKQGTSVAISADGNTAIVGGPADNTYKGAIWVFIRSGGSWIQQGTKLVGTGITAIYSSQGTSVSISADGNTVLVGGTSDNNNKGASWVFVRTGTSWTQQGTKLLGTGTVGSIVYQGSSVSLSADGNTAIVGGNGDDGFIGAVWIFTRSGSSWTQQGTKLVGSNTAESSNQGQAVSISADGNTVIVGGFWDGINPNHSGAVWIFTRTGSSWTQEGGKIVGTGAIGYANQGSSVSLSADGNTAIVGGYRDGADKGATWVYTRSSGAWTQQSKLIGTGMEGGSSSQGCSVSISADGKTSIVGGYYDNSLQGAAWVFIPTPPVPPTTQASAINFTSVAITSLTINWTNGNGSKRAVFVKEGSGTITNPVDNTTYTASADWNVKGTQLGTSGYYCVYNGTASTVSLSNLVSGTQYTVQVMEYNGSAGGETYLTTTATNNPNSQSTSTCYAGQYWTPRTASAAHSWSSVTYGNGLFVAVSSGGVNNQRVMTSSDGVTWSGQTPVFPETWNSVTYGNNKFVAVASTGPARVMTSPDGITWTGYFAAQDNNWNSVTYGNGKFVAVSGNGSHRVMTSPDGITWTARTAAEANSWYAITYGNGMFVALSYDGTNRVMTSPDGITWTAQTAAENNYWLSVTYGNGQFVAVSYDGTNRVMTSADGITWSSQTASDASSWYDVCYGNGLFVAIAFSGTNRVMTSPDGITWTNRSAEANSWRSVTYGNELFVAVSNSGTNRVMTSDCSAPPVIIISTQAVSTISTTTATGNGNITNIGSGNATNRGVIHYPYTGTDKIIGDADVTNVNENGDYGTGAFSASLTGLSVNTRYNARAHATNIGDGTQYGSRVDFWTLANVPSAPTVDSPNYTSLVVAVNANSNPTGTEFAIHETTTNKFVQADGTLGVSAVWQTNVNWGTKTVTGLSFNTQYTFEVKARNGGNVETAYSPATSGTTLECYAGQFWTPQTTPEYNNWYGVTCGNGLFVATGVNRVMSSADGVNWTAHPAAMGRWRATYGNGLFVAVSNYNSDSVITSPDGINWTSHALPYGHAWAAVTYGNGLFVAVSSQRFMTSPDGINWTLRTVPTSGWASVTYGNGLFVAVAGGGTDRVMTSPDGITWTARTAAQANTWLSITFGNGLFVAVSYDGINQVMTSPDGISWTTQVAAASANWRSVTHGNGLFAAVSYDGTSSVMTSPDGVTWTGGTAEANYWTAITYGNGQFVAVSEFGTIQVMTSDCVIPIITVSTQAATTISATSATGNGTITNLGSGNATNRGVIHYPFTGTDKIIGDADVTNVSENGDFSIGAFTASLTGLSVNTRYNARAHATNTGDGIQYGSRVDFWTLANVPSAPTVANNSATSLDVSVNVNDNPLSTEFTIHETSTNKFVQTDGTLGASAVWATAATWAIKTVTGLTTGTEYTFEVKARNGVNTETAYGTSANGTPLAFPTVTTQAASTITTTSATGNGNITATNGVNPTNRGVIYYSYSGTDKIIGDAGVTNVDEDGSPTFTTGEFTRSLTGLSVNTRYNARAHATNTVGTGYGSSVDFWTLANVPSAPTVNNPTATTLDVTINVNGNPASTEFAIRVNTPNKNPGGIFVQADGTLGSTIVWATAATWGTKTVTGLTTGTEYTFEVMARNGGNTETAYSATTSQNTCSNPTNGGTIGSDQTICYGTTPSAFTSSSGASNFGGTLEYKWQISTTSDATGFDNITSSNSTIFSPGALTQTSWYKRLARVDCKTDWTGAAETDVVEITVHPVFTAGEIEASGETICNHGDPAEIGNTTIASGGNGSIVYQWQSSLDAAFTTPTDINSNTPTYNPLSGLTETTWYRRQAKDETCNTSWNTSAGVWKVTPSSPNPILTGDNTVTQGQVVTYSTLYNNGNSYTWNASHGNPEVCFPNRNCLTLTWDFPCGVINPGYVTVTETNPSTGCSTTVTKWITIAQ